MPLLSTACVLSTSHSPHSDGCPFIVYGGQRNEAACSGWQHVAHTTSQVAVCHFTALITQQDSLSDSCMPKHTLAVPKSGMPPFFSKLHTDLHGSVLYT